MAETFNDPFVNNATPVWTGRNGLCQNEALLQWFAGESPSSAIGGAYSYPDPVLTTPSISEDFNCKPLPASVATSGGVPAAVASAQ
jgi:hypothetical protein